MLRYGLLLAAAVFVADQVSKWYVLGPLGLSPPGCRELETGCVFINLGPLVDLQMVWNRGISFGLFRADGELGRWVLVAAQLGIAGVFGWWLRTAERRITAVALGLVIGGALGNVIDRIRYGAVADFIDFSGPWFGWRIGDWPVGFGWVFNVADAAITVGAIVLAIDMIFFSEEPGKGTLWTQVRQSAARLWGRLLGAPDRS
jgi:signal peptidase II